MSTVAESCPQPPRSEAERRRRLDAWYLAVVAEDRAESAWPPEALLPPHLRKPGIV